MAHEDTTHDDGSSVVTDLDTAPSWSLVVALECDRPQAGAARFSLDGVDRVVIGRGAERRAVRGQEGGVVTLEVQVPASSMSRAHARLVRAGTQWAIDDLGSTNGSSVNGERVTRAVVGGADVISVGHVVFLLRAARRVSAAMMDIDSAHCVPDEMPLTLNEGFAHRLAAVARVAGSTVPVLLLGESGTGKEVVARAIHARSARTGGFVPVNCGAIPESLVEGQLFGHVRGAFSGAVRDEPGLVRSAHGGTLFLDEIADLPRTSQAALLRVLQEREVVAVGSTRAVKVDLRVVAATHQRLASLVERGAFRHDLFARLTGLSIGLPPLRERKEDIGLLIAQLLPRLRGSDAANVTFSPEAGVGLFAYDWPLNVRELERYLATAIALSQEGRIESSHLGAALRRELEGEEPTPDISSPVAEDPVRLALLEQLAVHRGRISDVARAMGKARPQVHRWLKRYGIDAKAYRR